MVGPRVESVPSHQKPSGPGARLGTSVVGSASFRTAAGLQYLPDFHQAELNTEGPERIVGEIAASCPVSTADLVSVRSFPDPVIERTEGYLADTREPNGDSLSVWIEWLDAPEVVASDTDLRLDVRVVATLLAEIRS
jgi:hypothetical protein